MKTRFTSRERNAGLAFASVLLVVACASNGDDGSTGGMTASKDAGTKPHDAAVSGDDGSSPIGGDDDDDGASDGGKSGGGGDASVTCDGGATGCGSACVDLMTDVQNCGTCGNACGSGQMCTGGACSCQTGYMMCAGGGSDGGAALACANVQGDPNNCGACGTGCMGNTGCSAGSCVAAATVDATGMCAMVDGSLSHSLAVDAGGHIYAGVVCGGEAMVAVSSDGTTFSAPVAVGISSDDTIENISLASSGTNVYAAIGTDAGLFFSVSSNSGATWSTPMTLSSVAVGGYVQVAASGTNVYIALPGSVYKNTTSGAGTFSAAMNSDAGVYGGVGVAMDGTVWVASVSSTMTVSLASSTNMGGTFSSFASAGMSAVYDPAFAFGPTSVDIVGTTPSSGDDPLLSIAYASATTEAETTGLSPVDMTTHARTIAVDASGNVYTFGQFGGSVVAQEFTGGQLSAPSAVVSDQDIDNLAVAAGSTAKTAYGMWAVGPNVQIFKFTF